MGLTLLLNLTVNYLLILAAGGLCQRAPGVGRALLGAMLGTVYALLCLLPQAGFFRRELWQLVMIPAMARVAYGQGWVPLAGALLVLHLSLGAVVSGSVRAAMVGLCAVTLLWLLLRRRQVGLKVPVTLAYEDKTLAIMALQDTGNCLRDPITGGAVLVIGPEAAGSLTGLKLQQLKAPLENVGALPGLRLIPYQAVGGAGFMLGLRLNQVSIGNWKGPHMVAFAPEGLGKKQGIEGLIGG